MCCPPGLFECPDTACHIPAQFQACAAPRSAEGEGVARRGSGKSDRPTDLRSGAGAPCQYQRSDPAPRKRARPAAGRRQWRRPPPRPWAPAGGAAAGPAARRQRRGGRCRGWPPQTAQCTAAAQQSARRCRLQRSRWLLFAVQERLRCCQWSFSEAQRCFSGHQLLYKSLPSTLLPGRR